MFYAFVILICSISYFIIKKNIDTEDYQILYFYVNKDFEFKEENYNFDITKSNQYKI